MFTIPYTRLVVLLFLTLFQVLQVAAQEQNLCTQTLKKALKTYDEGRISLVPPMLESCMKEGFTRAEKLQAYRLLILSYLFQDEDEKAEQTLLNLLKLDPEYKVNPAIDPAEFINLYNSYRTLPLWNVGIKAGLNFSQAYQLLPYQVDNPNTTNGSYTAKLGYQFGITADILLKNKFQLSTDFLYIGKKYEYENTLLSYSNLSFIESQSWFELSALLKYTFGEKKLRPYIQGGAGAGMLLASSASVLRAESSTSTNQAVGPDIDTKDLRKKFAYYAIAGGGLRYKVGYAYVVVDGRYSMGLRNITNPEERYSNSELLYKYGYISDNFTLNNIIFSLGYYKSLYKPKKIKTNAK